MAQETITIEFKPKGDEALIGALKQLDIVTKRLQGTVSRYEKEIEGLNRANKKATKSLWEMIFGVKNLRNSTGKLLPKFSVLRSKLLLISFAAALVTSGFKKLFDKMIIQEKAEKKLQAALGRTSQALLNQASALQKITIFGDEAIIGAQALIAAFTKDERAINAVTKATLDLAAAKGMDLKSAADLVSKSIFSSTNALSRYGIEIKGAVGSTQRLNQATREISKLYGGQARAEAETLGGSIQQMSNAFGDLAEVIGGTFAPLIVSASKSFKNLFESIQSLIDIPLEKKLQQEEAELTKLFNTLKDVNASAGARKIAMERINKEYSRYLPNLLDEKTSLEDLIKLEEDLRAERLKGIALSLGRDKISEAMVKIQELQIQEIELREQSRIAEKKYQDMKTAGLIQEGTLQDFIDKGYKNQINAGKNSLQIITESTAAWVANKFAAGLSTDEIARQGGVTVEYVEKIRENVKTQEELRLKIEEITDANERLANSFGNVIKGLGDPSSENPVKKFFDELKLEEVNKNVAAFKVVSDAIKGVGDAYLNMEMQNINQKKEADLAAAQSIKSERAREKAISKINAKAEKEEKKIRKRNQKFRIMDAIANTAVGMTKALELAFPLNVIVATLVAAQGAMQVATLKAQKFEQGGLVGGRRHSQGGTAIEAEKGEFVMSRSAVSAVGIETMNRINAGGRAGGINISFAGNVMSDDFIESEAIPKIKEAIRRGADIGVS